MQKTEENEQQAVLDIQPVSNPDTYLPDLPAPQQLAAEPTPVSEKVHQSESAIEPVPQPVSESVSEPVPEAVSEAVTEAVIEAVSEAVPEAVPEAVTEAVPEAVSDAVPEAVSEPVSDESVPEPDIELSADVLPPVALTVMPTKVQFSSFNLEPALEKAISDLGYEFCTPIQAESLRYTLRGYDVTGKAQTGTGKTAAFLITIINDLLKNPMQDTRYIGEPRAIVLAPTRELVMQIASDAANLTKHTDLHVVTLVGGEDYQKQLRQVDKRPVDIVVATPGRLIDFLQQDHLYLGLVELLVIDEADRMLDMGFIPQVRTIVSRTPHKDCRQTLLFSATFTPEIIELTSRWAMDPIMIEIQPERVATDNVEQLVYLVTTDDKYKLLYNLIAAEGADRVIVFNNRRDQVRKLADNLYRHGVSCGLLSGEIAQNKRVRTLEEFRDGTIKVLVATDVAGRGLHIDDVTHVINYSLPEEPEDYVHRIGRTGRAGSVGTSISFACEEDSFLLPNIEKILGQKLPCVYPDAALLVEPPPFSRPTHFKDESKPARSGGSSRPGQGRSGGGGKPRPRR
jgi:ATP-dependent RNA helicase RhlB